MGLNVSGPSGPLSDTSVPTLIDVDVTPTSDAVLAAVLAVVAGPDRTVADDPAAGRDFDVEVVAVTAAPDAAAAVVDVVSAAPAVVAGPPPLTTPPPSARACSKAESGSRVPH